MTTWLKDAFLWLFSMLEEKRDGLRRLSATRCTVVAFTVVYCIRLFRLDLLNWPEAFVAFCVLFALGISKAISSAPPTDVLEAVTGMFGRGGSAGSSSFTSTTTHRKTAGVLGAEDLAPPVARGRPDPEDEP